MKFHLKTLILPLVLATVLILSACSGGGTLTLGTDPAGTGQEPTSTTSPTTTQSDGRFPNNPNLGVDYSSRTLSEIWLAGGCFWGVEAYMARIYGVADASVGYANGTTETPSYEDVVYRNTGHAETVQIGRAHV